MGPESASPNRSSYTSSPPVPYKDVSAVLRGPTFRETANRTMVSFDGFHQSPSSLTNVGTPGDGPVERYRSTGTPVKTGRDVGLRGGHLPLSSEWGGWCARGNSFNSVSDRPTFPQSLKFSVFSVLRLPRPPPVLGSRGRYSSPFKGRKRTGTKGENIITDGVYLQQF